MEAYLYYLEKRRHGERVESLSKEHINNMLWVFYKKFNEQYKRPSIVEACIFFDLSESKIKWLVKQSEDFEIKFKTIILKEQETAERLGEQLSLFGESEKDV